MSKGRDLSVESVQNTYFVQNERTIKPSKKLMEAIGWLKTNDPDGKLSFRDAAEKSGVSVGTIQNARKHLQQNKDR